MINIIDKMEYNNYLKDKFLGCIVGSSVGDSLGAPFEFQKRSKVIKSFDANKYLKLFYTDDTQLTLALMESIIEAGDNFQNIFGKKLANWGDEMFKNNGESWKRKPGLTTLKAAGNFKKGFPINQCGIEGALGNGAAMRISPIGLFYDEYRVVEPSKMASEITHKDPRIYVSSSMLAYAISRLKKTDPGAFNAPLFLNELIEHVNYCESRFGRKEKFNMSDILKDIKSYYPTMKFIDKTNNTGKCYDSVPLALYCFLIHPTDFMSAVSESVCLGDDSDTSACITGAMSGALNGIKSVPKKFIDILENKDYILELGSLFFEKYKQKEFTRLEYSKNGGLN